MAMRYQRDVLALLHAAVRDWLADRPYQQNLARFTRAYNRYIHIYGKNWARMTVPIAEDWMYGLIEGR